MKRIICILLCLVLLSGCAPAGSETAGQDAVRFTDALGREVAVEKAPRRVAALLGSFADLWVLAGGTLCAAPEDAWEDFSLALPEAVDLGGAHSPNLELLLGSAPELVLASASTAGHVALRETLEQAGIPVVYFDVDNFDDYLDMLRVCTDITGRQELYRQNGLALQAQIGQLKEAYAQAPLPPEQRTVLLLRASSGFVKAKDSRGTVLGEMLADMGCVNIADSRQGLLEDLSVEAVLQAQPYHIFVVTMGSDTAAAEASLEKLFRENPAWGSLEAVTQGRVHVMDKTLFNLKPNGRWAEAYEILYRTLTEE